MQVDDCKIQMCACLVVEVCVQKMCALLKFKWVGKKCVCVPQLVVCVCVCYCICHTVPVLAGLQLPQPQPWAERVARVGMVPNCRQAHYLSLAKKKEKQLIMQKNHSNQERESIYLLPDLERVPIAFHVATRTHTHHGCHKFSATLL